MRSFSFLASVLVSAIVGPSQMATAIQLSDFTAMQNKGGCVDSIGNAPAFASSPFQEYTTDVAMQNYCVRYCGQNLATTFLGFETHHGNANTEFYCSCIFNLPTFPGDETTGFPYQFTPFPKQLGSGNGTAIADGDGKHTSRQCYKYNGTPTGSASPTGVHTPAPTVGQVGASDFTYLGEGDCTDASGKYFSDTASQAFTWTSQDDAAAKCTSWCGQNANANFRAFVIDYMSSHSPPDFKCNCYFDLPGQRPPYYDYNPPRDNSGYNGGTGSIVKTNDLTNYFCYKYNGSSGGGTLHPTKAPTKPGTKAPTKPGSGATLHPTKAPTKPGSGTLHPTKAPTKPGSCPVGHPSCVSVADCSTSSVFSHCVDGCCASLGSKSAKKSKSSKRV